MKNVIAYRSFLVTADVAKALRALEADVLKIPGCRLSVEGVSAEGFSWDADLGPTQLFAPTSLRPTGREVYLRAALRNYDGPESSRKASELSVLWAAAVPLGFVPYSRYPNPGPLDHVFHYFGPWTSLGASLNEEGRADVAYSSIACAAQLEVGSWRGDRTLERSVQSQLHRLGFPCGPIDGIVGDRTLVALRAAGCGGLSLVDALSSLEGREAPERKPSLDEEPVGYVNFPVGPCPVALPSGGVRASRIPTGYKVSVSGSGRLVLVFGE